MSLPTPNYVLNEIHHVGFGADAKVLKPGVFARPIELRYVPKHITEENIFFDEASTVYCYTFIGIVPIPRNKLREV